MTFLLLKDVLVCSIDVSSFLFLGKRFLFQNGCCVKINSIKQNNSIIKRFYGKDFKDLVRDLA